MKPKKGEGKSQSHGFMGTGRGVAPTLASAMGGLMVAHTAGMGHLGGGVSDPVAILPGGEVNEQTREMLEKQLEALPQPPYVAANSLAALAAGTGLRVRSDPLFEREMMRRLTVQDIAVLLLLGLIYMMTIGLGVSVVYRIAENTSAVRWFCDPRAHLLTCSDNDADAFLQSFNRKPSSQPRLQIAGLEELPSYEGISSLHAITWEGLDWQTAFNSALDLEPFLPSTGCLQPHADACYQLQQFMASTNSLETLTIKKRIVWPGLQDLRASMQQELKALGFTGPLRIAMQGEEDDIVVYQNKQWANFMHHRTTKTLLALSVVGGLLYLPYMWLRCKERTIVTEFKVRVDKIAFFHMIRKGLCAQGGFKELTAAAANSLTAAHTFASTRAGGDTSEGSTDMSDGSSDEEPMGRGWNSAIVPPLPNQVPPSPQGTLSTRSTLSTPVGIDPMAW